MANNQKAGPVAAASRGHAGSGPGGESGGGNGGAGDDPVARTEVLGTPAVRDGGGLDEGEESPGHAADEGQGADGPVRRVGLLPHPVPPVRYSIGSEQAMSLSLKDRHLVGTGAAACAVCCAVPLLPLL